MEPDTDTLDITTGPPGGGVDAPAHLGEPDPEPTDLNDVYQSVADAEPDHAAKVIKIARKTGQQPDFVNEELPAFERAAYAPNREQFAEIKSRHPVVGNFLSDPLHMAVAYDDAENLVAHSHVNKQLEEAHGFADSIVAGLQGSILGMEFRGRTPDMALPADASFAEKFTGSAAQFAADFPYMAAGGAFGAGAAAPLGPVGAGLVGFGASFALPDALREALRQHYDEGDDQSAADLLKKVFTLNTLKKGVKGFGIGVLTGGAGAAARPLGELAAGAAEIGTMTTAGSLAEGKRPEAADFASNALLVGLMHGAGHIGEYGLDRAFPQRIADTIRVDATKDAAELLDEASRASKLRSRDPEGFNELMDKGKPVMIPVDAYEKYFQSKGIDPDQVSNDLGITESHDIAKKTGGEVIIPQGAYLGKDMDAHRAGLIDDIKFNQDHLTANELKQVEEDSKEQAKAQQEFVKTQGDLAAKEIAKNPDTKIVHDDITADARERLEPNVPVDMLLKDKNKWLDENAKIVANHYLAEGSRRGVDPKQLYEQEFPRIAGGGETAPGALEQAPDHPAFKKWFGESKVINEDGKPRIVYHGTTKDFTKFDKNAATMGGITWFSSNPKTSDVFAGSKGDVGMNKYSEGANVKPLYVRIENPAGWDEYEKLGLGQLKSEGYDGVILKDKDGSFDGFAFEPKQFKSAVGNNGKFSTSSADILKQGAQGEYVPSINEIRLNKNSDASTFMHEFAHGALQHMFEFVQSGQANEGYLDHFSAVKDFLGIKDDQAKLTTEQHEKFARGFERYLRGEDEQTGARKAPTPELQSAFGMFRRWLTSVYRQVKGSPLEGELTPEVRGFFDRMLATDDSIQKAVQEAGYKPGEIENIPDVDPAQQARHRTLQERAREQAENELLKDQMAELRSENQFAIEQERERQTKRISPEVAEHPLYAASQDVEENRPGQRKAASTLADEFLSGKLSDQERGAFESAAEVHGFADGRDLAESIKADAEAGGQEGTVKRRVDQAMAPFDALKNTDALRESALKAIHDQKMTELLALEQQILSEMQHDKEVRAEVAKRNRVSASMAAANAKQQAKDYLESRPLREASTARTFITAERNAAIRVSKAIAAEDYAAASEAKGQQMLNHALAAEAMKNKAEVARKGKFLDKFIKRGQDMKNMPFGFVTKIDDILVQHGLMNPRDPALQDTLAKNAQAMSEKGESPADIANATGLVQGVDGSWVRETLPAFVARVNDDYYPITLPDSVMGAQGEGLHQFNKNMTLADLRDLHEAVKIVNSIGTGFERFLSDFIKGDIKTNAREFKEQVEKNIGTPHGNVPALGDLDMNRLEKAVAAIKALPDGMIASKVNLLTLCEYLDRMDPDGQAKKNIYRPLREAENRERAMKADYAEQLNAIREKHYSKDEIARMGDESFAKWQIQTPDGMKNVRLTKENALVMLLNRGSETNLDRLVRGFGVDAEKIKEITDGLDKRDHDFAQDIWNYVNKLWPEASALEMKVNGVEPVKVKPTPVESRHGTYDGGYYPLSYDFTKSADAYKNAEQRNALFKQYSTAAAHTEQGALQERVKSLDRPVRLTFDGLFNHLEDVIHDISYRPSVIDVNRFLNQSDAKNAIVNAVGIDGYKKINDDLKAAASAQTDFMTPTDKRMRWFRFATSFATLGYRVAIFPRRMSEDVMNAMREVGFRNAVGATADYIMNPTETREFVQQNIPVMRERGVTRERDLMEMSRQWKGRESKIKMYAFLQDTIADQAMSYPVASAVYKANLEKYGPEKAAQIAGESIIKTFGSGSQIDRVGAQRGGELNQLISMYYSWHSMMFNRAWLQGKIAGLDYNEGNYGKALAVIAATTATTWVIPAATDIFWHEALHNAPNGEESDEDKNKRRLAKLLEAPFAYFPMARSVAAFGIPHLVGEKGRDYKMSPAEDAIESLTKTVADGTHTMFDPDKKFEQKDAEQAARSASILIGTPNQLNTMVFNFKDYLDGEGELTWRDLVSRRTKR